MSSVDASATDTPLPLTIGETSTISDLNHNSQTIELQHSYNDPVVFAQPLSYNGSDPATICIEDIQSDSFTASIQEPNYEDGWHTEESFNYFVLEAGTWQLDDGTLLEVGTTDTNLLASEGWETVNFTHEFAEAPVVFSQVQTKTGSDFVRTRQKEASASGFQLTLEEEEARENSGHTTESLGWSAISSGEGEWNGHTYQVGQTANRVTEDWHQIDFSANFSEAPQFLSSMGTYDGSNPAGLRYHNIGNDTVQVKLEEDTSADQETKHTTEAVNFLAMDDSSSLTAIPTDGGKVDTGITAGVSDTVSGDPISRGEPAADTSVKSPPFEPGAWDQSWGAGQGLAPQNWFWEEVPAYQEKKETINRVAAEHEAEGVVPTTGLQLWKSTFKESQPGGKFADKEGHEAWVEWIEARPELLGVNKNGENLGWGYVSPLVPLDPKDFPEDFEGKSAYYADWQAERLGRLAAFTGINGFSFSDFFDSHPGSGVANYFNARIIEDFESRMDVTLSSGTLTEQADEIRSQHYQEWIDYFVDRWAYNWEALTREIGEHTDEEPWLVSQTSFAPAAMRRKGAVDARAIMQNVSPDNILFNVQTVLPFMMRQLSVPESRESAMLGLYAAREPSGRYGHMIMSSEDRYWNAVDELWPNLSEEAQEELGWKRLKRTWLESGLTHVATRQGDVRRATESWTRSYHDQGKTKEPWVELLRDIVPTRPFGPALYYSVPIERAVEANAGADSNQITSSYLGQHLQPVTDLKEAGVPFNYYVSDAALNELQDDFQPSAWIVPDRYQGGEDLLPEKERAALEKTAPILSEEEAKTFDYPLSFSTGQEGRTITGFGFYDQNDRLIVVASDRIQFDESNSNLGKVKATINLDLPDGKYTARELLTGQETDFNVASGSGEFNATIKRWDTKVFAITPVSG